MSDYFKSITSVPAEEGVGIAAHSVPAKDMEIVRQLVGLNARIVDETLAGDIEDLLAQKIPNALDGYLHCMSRLMRHDVAWQIILDAYKKCGMRPPAKYAQLFGKSRPMGPVVESNYHPLADRCF